MQAREDKGKLSAVCVAVEGVDGSWSGVRYLSYLLAVQIRNQRGRLYIAQVIDHQMFAESEGRCEDILVMLRDYLSPVFEFRLLQRCQQQAPARGIQIREKDQGSAGKSRSRFGDAISEELLPAGGMVSVFEENKSTAPPAPLERVTSNQRPSSEKVIPAV